MNYDSDIKEFWSIYYSSLKSNFNFHLHWGEKKKKTELEECFFSNSVFFKTEQWS